MMFVMRRNKTGQVGMMARVARGCRINVNSEEYYKGVRSRVAVTPRPGGDMRLVESENAKMICKGGEEQGVSSVQDSRG